jgi:hypothetical protein
MLLTHGSFVRLVAFSALPLVPVATFSQSPTPSSPHQAAAAPAHPCYPMANVGIPSRVAIEAKVTGLDSTRLQPGKEIWFKIARPFNYAVCSLDADSVVYARVVSATPSELSLDFDYADCNRRDHQPLKLRVIAIVGPPSEAHHMHDDMPTEVAGGVRQMAQVVYGTDEFDEDLTAGGPPHTIRPGVVAGIKDLKLEPTRGPECSDLISTDAGKIQLAPGSELILVMTVTRVIHRAPNPAASAPHP